MLRTTSGLSRPVLKWVSQVTASLGATLSATLIWSAVPHPGAVPAPSPELTSGGKFAARAIQPTAYDGLDTMPLPHVVPAPARFVAPSIEAASPAILHRASWDEATPLPSAPERAGHAGRPVPHAPPRAEARRAEPSPRAAAMAEAVTEAREPDAEADEGVLHRVIPSSLPRILPSILATAQDAWTVTASGADLLVAHVVPRIP